jgi:hypothetical protein
MKSYQQIKLKIREIRQQIAKVERHNKNSANWLRAYWEALQWVLDSK